MKIWTKTLPFLAAVSLASGCIGGGDDTGDTEGATDTGTGMTAPTTAMTTMADTGSDDTPDDTADDTAGTADGTTAGTADDTAEGGSSSTGPDPTIPEFNDTPFEDYVQNDRMGFPAINTALIASANKDAYNAGSPTDDVADTWLDDIVDSLDYLHEGGDPQPFAGAGLDNDLAGLMLTPCIPPSAPMDNCITQAGPAAIPDVLMIDTDSTLDPTDIYQLLTVGRPLDIDIMDVILAVVLLDLGDHSVLTFWDLNGDMTPGDSLNPFTNDVEFPGAWPHLAAPNTP